MKRFYLSALTVTALAGMAFSGMSAMADAWHGISPASQTEQSVAKKAPVTPADLFRRRMGQPVPGNLPQPAGDGPQTIRNIRQKPDGYLTRSLEAPIGNLYGIVNRHISMEVAEDAYVLQINPGTLQTSKLYNGAIFAQAVGTSDFCYKGACEHNGILYVSGSVPVLSSSEFQITEVDLATGNIIANHGYGSNPYGSPYTMAYDEAEDVIYALSFDQDTANNLVKIDPNDNFKITFIENIGTQFFAAIAYNPVDKKIYIFDENNMVYELNKAVNSPMRLIPVAEIESDFSLFTNQCAGLVVYSPKDQGWITIWRDETYAFSTVMTIDPKSWTVQEIGNLKGNGNIFISSIVCTDALAPGDAPEMPLESVFTFSRNNLAGKITVRVPSTTYYGLAIPSDKLVNISLKCDGKEIFNKDLTPGKMETFDYTLTEGLHEFETTASLGKDLVSPVRRQTKYIGNDTPVPPSNIELNGKTLSWSAPVNIGIHNGYVDTNALTYDVYVDGVKQNNSPVTERSFELSPTQSQSKRTISVTASANGYTSAFGSINSVYGTALSLPFSVTPTQAQSDLFTINNADGDAFTWLFTTDKNDASKSGMAFPISLYDDANDWLILPLINFPDKNKLYQFNFDISSVQKYESIESFDIFLSPSLNVKAMKDPIYSVDNYNVSLTPKTVSVNFAVPKAGDYYLAIHCRSLKSNSAKGMFTQNFLVRDLDGKTSAVPAAPAKCVVTAAPKAAMAIDIELTMPTADLIGNPLNTADIITAKASCGELSATAQAAPGQTVKFSCPVANIGFNTIELLLSNANGDGMKTTYRQYVGIDTPFPPTNITSVTAKDNKSMTLTWDAPGEVGVNGGYVDPDKLTYAMYMRTSSLTYETIKTGLTDTKYTFTPGSSTMETYTVGPVSVSEGGISQNSLFQRDALGTPYEIPMHEDFGTAKFTYNHNLYRYNTDGIYSNSMWENHNNISAYGVGDAQENQGALMGFSASGAPCRARISLPKASTAGFNDKVKFRLRYWDYMRTPAIDIYARESNDQTWRKIHTFQPNKPIRGTWVDGEFELPQDLHNNSWVEFAIECSLTGADLEYLVIDNYEISQDVEYDLKVNPITGPSSMLLGTTQNYTFSLMNAGSMRNNGKLLIDITTPDGEVIQSREVNIRNINGFQTNEYKVPVEINGEFAQLNRFLIRATAVADNDQIESNNVRTLSVDIQQSQLPVVSSLKGEFGTDGKPELSWRKPRTTYGSIFDVELEEPFQLTENFGDWGNFDLDGREPLIIGANNVYLNWPGYEKPSAWTVFDVSQTVMATEERMQPHSGKYSLMARPLNAPSQDEQYQASDWLVSPEVKGGTQLEFYYNTVATDQKEFIYLWISTTGNKVDFDNATATECGDFFRVRPFSKIGSEGWERVTYTLPAEAKYFALVYSSFATSGAFIDDIKFTPAKLNEWTIDHYSLWRKYPDYVDECIADNITDLSFVDSDFNTAYSGAQYYLKAHVIKDGRMLDGPKSNTITVGTTGVSSVQSLSGVFGGKGYIEFVGHEGDTVKVYTTDGRLAGVCVPSSYSEKLHFAPGIYMVTSGNKTSKVLVK
ncbi:MAG: choice-of-anchor J domain-containing protein [Muribaculum sp.]|nr:choice-of-anchor J domain-containing protein [Muribaculum sp.]